MKLGLLLCAYNTEEYIRDCLEPWISRNDVVISCVSLPFLEYKGIAIKRDKTQEILRHYYNIGKIKYLFTEPEYIKEHEARNTALQPLFKEKVDFVFLADADEIYEKREVNNVIRFLDNSSFVDTFNTSFKNICFDGNVYLDDFCPPRGFRVDTGRYLLSRCFWDNDFKYMDKNSRQEKDYREMSNLKIPKHLVHPKHFTWLNNERSRQKIAYQEAHFKSGAGCSFKVSKEPGKIEFNEEFFKKTNQQIPELIPLTK